jgi:hypothetical protein
MMWSIFRDGRRATVAAFFTKESAESMIASWVERHAKGGRPDVEVDGLYADVIR